MSGHELHLTPYQEVNAVLKELLTAVQRTLGYSFTGLYLYGSLATSGFALRRSDIDFLVVVRDDLTSKQIANLDGMHLALSASESSWAKKLEGVYLPYAALRRHDPDGPPRPTLNESQFYQAPLGPDWVIQRHVLREHERIVHGPSLRTAIDPVSADDLRQAVHDILEGWWAPMLADPARLEAPGYQPFAVLSMCRAIYTLERGELATKSEAAHWAIGRLGPDWQGLIKHALAWGWGEPVQSYAQTIAFMEHVLRESRRRRLAG